MDIQNSLLISVFGMSVVFLVLAVLILLINVQTFLARKLMSGATAKDKGMTSVADAPVPEAPIADPQGLTLVGLDERTAAIVMAIVCDHTGSSPEQLYFRSIRALDESPSEPLGRSTPA